MTEDINAPMMVIRKRLSPDELGSPRQRTNPTTGEFEISPDGTTWTPAPEADPRISDAFRLPPLTGGTARCDAAARMRAYIQEQMENAVEFTDKATIATSFLVGLASILIASAVGALFGVLLLVADTLVTLGISSVTAALTDEMFDELECIIYRHLSVNGQMDAFQAEAIRADVTAEIGGTAAIVIGLMFDAFGQVGLSNAAVVRTETGACDACVDGWILIYDATKGAGGWFSATTGGYQVVAPSYHVQGVGWRAGRAISGGTRKTELMIRQILPAMIVSKAKVWSTHVEGIVVPAGTRRYTYFSIESPEVGLINVDMPHAELLEATGTWSTNGARHWNFQIRPSIVNNSGVPTGDATLTRVELYGTGTIPTKPAGDEWELIT